MHHPKDMILHTVDGIYSGCFCYTNCGEVVGTRHFSIGQPRGIDLMTLRTVSGRSTTELRLALGHSYDHVGGDTSGNDNDEFDYDHHKLLKVITVNAM